MCKYNIFKHIIRCTKLLLVATTLTLSSCKHFDEPEGDSTLPEAANMSIGDLRNLVGDRVVDIEEDIIIGGYVTSSDREGNFYRTLTIEDSSGGVEIMAGLYDLHNIYPIGYYLSVKLSGCSAGKYNGVLQIGTRAASYSNYPTDYFSSRALLELYLTRFDLRREVAPQVLSIGELREELCGKLVSIGGLTLSTSQGDGAWEGYSIFTDSANTRIAVYTSAYADYASKKIPSSKVAITGILQQAKVDGEKMFVIKMRYESDCSHYN